MYIKLSNEILGDLTRIFVYMYRFSDIYIGLLKFIKFINKLYISILLFYEPRE